MCRTIKIAYRRKGFTLVEMLVVIGIILVIAALAAAFAPRITDSTNLSRAVDNLEQWLLTAKMRAKRDGLATGIRFIPDPNNPNSKLYYQIQYIQQPDPLTGGLLLQGTWTPPNGSPTGSNAPPPPPNSASTTFYLNGSMCLQSPNLTPLPPLPPIPIQNGQVQIYNFDPSIGGTPFGSQWLVQPGDVLELRDGGVYTIAGVVTPGPIPNQIPTTTGVPPVPVTTLQLGIISGGATAYYSNPVVPPMPMYINGNQWLPTNPPMVWASSYEQSLNISSSGTANFRIIRQPRILIGEEPLALPNNYAVDLTATYGSNVQFGTSGYYEILFAPSGAVIGANAANGITGLVVYDTTMTPFDLNRAGLVAVQTRTGFIGAYNVGTAPNFFQFVQLSRESGL
jgi:prepilin-type N-terminal cleavage/methylation domain-containing protein